MIETHVHFNLKKIGDVEKVIENALAAGVKKFVVVGFDLISSKKAIQLSEKYPFIYAAIGCHPCDYQAYNDEFAQFLITNGNHPKVVAIGEIGLDYHWVKIDSEQIKQQEVFKKQLEIASKLQLPIIIHSRNSNEQVYAILKQQEPKINRGIIHSFSGTPLQALELIEQGFKIGIGGVITYPNGLQMRQVVETINIQDICLETDAPYLTPEPFRRNVNEPKYLPVIAHKIAQLKEVDMVEIEKLTTLAAYEALPKLKD